MFARGHEATFVGRATWQPGRAQSGHANLLHTLHLAVELRRPPLATSENANFKPTAAGRDHRCSKGKSDLTTMHFRPQASPLPAVVFADGHEPVRSFEAAGPALSAQSYLVLGEHRGGSGLSADRAANLLRRLSVIERSESAEARWKAASAEPGGRQLAEVTAAIVGSKPTLGSKAADTCFKPLRIRDLALVSFDTLQPALADVRADQEGPSS